MRTLNIEEQLYLFRKIKKCLITGTTIPQHIFKYLYNNLGVLEWDSWDKHFIVNMNKKPCLIMTISIVKNNDIICYKGIMTQYLAIWFKEIEKYYKIQTML